MVTCNTSGLRRNAVLMLAFWTAILASSLAWNVYNERQQTREVIKEAARANFNKDQAFRLWATDHGGVYVRVGRHAQPNPNLDHLPDRDIVTPRGETLTLMNPAEMVRQMMDDYAGLFGIQGRITSLQPLRAENMADAWEQKALAAFEAGVPEVFEFTENDGTPQLRLMRPMFTAALCLKCHGHQGFEPGDVQGGVGIAVPMGPFLVRQNEAVRILALTHGGVWLLGLGGIGFGYSRGRQRLQERAEADAQLREANDALEERVQERTHDLEAEVAAHKKTEAELRRAKDEAEWATRAKSEFLANMSHELRTPLNAVIGFSDVMRAGIFGPVGDSRYREYLDNIHTSGEHLLSLINDILDIAKIEAGEFELHEEAVDVVSAAETCLTLVRPRADKGGVRLEADLPNGLPHLRADERRLKQILMNLLSNGVKFTPEGGAVKVSAEVASEDGFVLRVSDTGVGMDADGVIAAMEPFRQVDGSLARKEEGTGLGLPLTHHLVEAHQGSMTIESTPGAGTTVSVFFPRHRLDIRPAA